MNKIIIIKLLGTILNLHCFMVMNTVPELFVLLKSSVNWVIN